MFVVSSSIFALEPIKYLDENGEEQTVTDYKILTGEEASLTRGWYVVQGQIKFNTPNWSVISVLGNVNLVLMDDCECIVNGSGGFDGIDFGSKMKIYSQSHGEHEGKMTFRVVDLFCFHMWEMGIYGGSYYLDGCKDQCAGFAANEVILKNCKVEIDAYDGFWGNYFTIDGVDLSMKVRKVGMSGGKLTIKNSDRMTKMELSCSYNKLTEPVELSDGTKIIIAGETYTGSIPVDVINGVTYAGTPSEKNNTVKVEDISDDVSPKNSGWYTLNGIRLDGKPTSAGIYIHDGRKVIVK